MCSVTIPLWAPFALLSCVCAVWPKPSWMRQVDWLRVAALVYCVSVWTGVVLLVVEFA